jgi:acyl carrier protein
MLESAEAAREKFTTDLVQFINETVPSLHAPLKSPPNVTVDTPLFETGLIDSLAILHLIAYVERATGQAIPPRMVVMKHFRTVQAICDSFGPTATEVEA